MNIVDNLKDELELAELALTDHENDVAAVTLRALEAKALLVEAQKQVKKLTSALEIVSGEIQMPVAENTTHEGSILLVETVAEVIGQPNGGETEVERLRRELAEAEAKGGSLIVPASTIPGPEVDPNSQAALEGWVKGLDGRYAPVTEQRPAADIEKQQEVARNAAQASGPRCGGCGKRGTLQQAQHESGRIITICTACNNQIW